MIDHIDGTSGTGCDTSFIMGGASAQFPYNLPWKANSHAQVL